MSKNEGKKNDEPRLIVTTKGNSGCSACGAVDVKQCRCRGASGGGSGDAETNPQALESKEDVVSPTLSIKLEYQTGLTPKLERHYLLSAQNIFAQFKQELKNQKVDVSEYAAAIIGNELQVKIHDPIHRNAFIQRLNNNPLAAQNNLANGENDGAKANSSSIKSPYALPQNSLVR